MADSAVSCFIFLEDNMSTVDSAVRQLPLRRTIIQMTSWSVAAASDDGVIFDDSRRSRRRREILHGFIFQTLLCPRNGRQGVSQEGVEARRGLG